MMSNGNSLSHWRLYVILDSAASKGRDLAWVAECAIHGGADVIQLRDKTASTRQLIEEAERIARVARAAQIPLLINDRVDVAVAVGAAGVHLGQDDLSVSVARRILGSAGMIGKSTHSLQQALKAEQEGVDYLAVGPIYPTPTKPDTPHVGLALIGQVKTRVRRPLVAIGGVDRATLPDVVAAGAECVAVVRAVCSADDPQAAAHDLKKIVAQSVRI